jgi:hypothetical protein
LSTGFSIMAPRFDRRAQVLARLAAIPRHVRKAVGDAMQAGADEITEMQKRFAPVGVRDPKRVLKKSIYNVKGEIPGARPDTTIRGDPDLTIHLLAGGASPYTGFVWYARHVEFGTKPHVLGGRFAGRQHPGTRPQPFFFPVYRTMRRRYKARVTRAMRRAIRQGGP